MSIELKNVSYVYMPGTPYEHKALQNISLTIEAGTITALAGHTGSGKSTLLQHLNGLLKPAAGQVIIDGVDITDSSKGNKKAATAACHRVGMVFQYPEQQLFEETVFKDIAFGPMNQGLAEAEVTERVKEAMAFVRLDYKGFKDRSPFALSGGQKRRAAIAGIIAMRPDYLVLDEPVAGLDPRGKVELMEAIQRLHRERHTTIILVSHSMDDIAAIAQQVVVLNKGQIMLQGTPREVFSHKQQLEEAGLRQPWIMERLAELKQAGIDVPADCLTLEEGARAIIKAVK